MLAKTMKIGKRGSGLWLRIPAAIARELNLQIGEKVELTAVRNHSFELRRTTAPPSVAKEAQAPSPAA
jgi:antitoxin component of MazEF toxin-antitoxin module